jgi:hypothetical protein
LEEYQFQALSLRVSGVGCQGRKTKKLKHETSVITFSLPLLPPSCSLKLAHSPLSGTISSSQFFACSLRVKPIGQK